MPIFMIFSLTPPGIEPESTVSVADALSTQPLTNLFTDACFLSMQIFDSDCFLDYESSVRYKFTFPEFVRLCLCSVNCV